MAECKDCIYSKMCYWIAVFGEKTPCEHFLATADVVPKSKYDLAVAEREANVKGFTDDLAKAKTEAAREIIDELLEGLQYEIDTEDKLGRNAWGEGDTVGYHIHQYAEEKLDTLKIALSLYKKKYTEGEPSNS